MNPDNNNLQLSNFNDESSLWELIEEIRSGWAWMFMGVLVGLACAFIFLFFSTLKFEASAVIQPATVGTGAPSTIGSGSLSKLTVEPVLQTLERLKIASFYSEETVKACGAKSPMQLARNIKATLLKSNTLIQVNFRADTISAAEECVARVVSQLSASLSILANPLIKELEEQKKLTKLQIEEIEQFLSEYSTLTVNEGRVNSMSSLLFLNIKLKRDELLSLRKLYSDQSALLSEPLTQPLKTLEKIYASDQPVYPLRTLVIAVGLASGFFAGLILFFLNRSWRRFKFSSTG